LNYLSYMLAVLLMGLVCLVAIRLYFKNPTKRPAANGEETRLAVLARKLLGRKLADRQPLFSKSKTNPTVLDRQLSMVRTPWGWPNHQAYNGQPRNDDMSGALKKLTNRLVREKQLAGTDSGNPRLSNSIRALLEDRYGPVHRDAMTSVEYSRVKRLLLRDPNAPHDQMDNFGAQEAERIRAKLKRLKALKATQSDENKREETGEETRYVAIKDIKQPWGW
jgi:hypothetical protein